MRFADTFYHAEEFAIKIGISFVMKQLRRRFFSFFVSVAGE